MMMNEQRWNYKWRNQIRGLKKLQDIEEKDTLKCSENKTKYQGQPWKEGKIMSPEVRSR
jgi:hypothetical protein